MEFREPVRKPTCAEKKEKRNRWNLKENGMPCRWAQSIGKQTKHQSVGSLGKMVPYLHCRRISLHDNKPHWQQVNKDGHFAVWKEKQNKSRQGAKRERLTWWRCIMLINLIQRGHWRSQERISPHRECEGVLGMLKSLHFKLWDCSVRQGMNRITNAFQ